MVVWLKTVEEMKLDLCTGLISLNNGVSGHFIDTVKLSDNAFDSYG